MKYISFFLKTLLFIMSLLSLVFLILWSVQNKDTIERTYDSILSESQKTDIECILKVPRIIPLEYLSYQYFGMKNHIAYVGGNAGFENSLKNNGNRVTEEEINAYERAVRIYSVYNKAKENSGKLSAVHTAPFNEIFGTMDTLYEETHAAMDNLREGKAYSIETFNWHSMAVVASACAGTVLFILQCILYFIIFISHIVRRRRYWKRDISRRLPLYLVSASVQ